VNNQSHPMALQVGFELHWYRVEGVLGQGAFGITYLAHDVCNGLSEKQKY